MAGYATTYRLSADRPEEFWRRAAADIDWVVAPTHIIDGPDRPGAPWFADGRLNTAYNAVDRHCLAGRGTQPALIYDSPVTDTRHAYTFDELRDEVARIAGGLSELGVHKGDVVLIYMPMIPEAVFGMLACARLGAVHSVVFGGFAAAELAARIDHCRPKMILSSSCGIEPTRTIAYKPLLDGALEIAEHSPDRCVIAQRTQLTCDLGTSDLDWQDTFRDAPMADCVPVSATDPLYVLYTSGTTGRPKGIVRDNGGHAVALRYSMEAVYDTRPGETFWAASDVGWVVGHSYIVYGPLLAGCTTVLYEGKPVGTPDAGAFWRVIAEHGVSTMFTAPTAVRAIKQADAPGALLAQYDLSALRALFLAGERLDPDTYQWVAKLLGVPIVDHWWQTESGWPMAANCLGIERHPAKPGSATFPVPGYDIAILDAEGGELDPGTEGDIALRLPLPPGTLTGLWNDPAGFENAYFSAYPGYYRSGDGGYFDDDGYLWVMGRVDDVINVAGHRISTGALEEVVAAHPSVAECAVIGVSDELKGQLPLALVVLKRGASTGADDIARVLKTAVRDQIGAIVSLKEVVVVERLPKTRSGKILRATMRKIADGRPYESPATIDDPQALEEVGRVLRPTQAAKKTHV